MRRIAIVGLPNTGKSEVYNHLTGDYNIVANYPLTTIEVKQKTVKIHGEKYEIIDTPGLHDLFVHSEEELFMRNFLLEERPDGIIQCIDSNRIRLSLRLTLDLIELGIPLAICLNSIDDTDLDDIGFDPNKLSGFLGIPVVDFTNDGAGAERLKNVLNNLTPSSLELSYGEEIDSIVNELEAAFPSNVPFRRLAALLLIEGDHFILEGLGLDGRDAVLAEERFQSLYRRTRSNPVRLLAKRRALLEEVILNGAGMISRTPAGKTARLFAEAARHPVFGFPILGAIIVVTYLLVVEGAGAVEGVLSGFIVDPVVERISSAVSSEFFRDFLVGPYGILTLGLFNAIVTVLPVLTAFFIMLGLLEDTGYLPNLSVLTRRVLGRIGLTGKSIMSLVLGFGCKTMATMTTRNIRSRKEKLIAIYLIAFAIPCSAQLAIDIAILGRIGVRAFLIYLFTLALVEIAAGFILNKILPDDEGEDFIQELPPIRAPKVGAIAKKTGYRLLWFLKEAVPVFVIASIVLFAAERTGILNATKRFLSPVVTGWLGLPLDIVEVLILSLARHEAAAGLLLNMVDGGALSYVQSLVAVVITTMFVPCFANIVAMCRQIGVVRGLAITLIINVSSFVLAGILNWILIAAGL
ncbi:MAG: ferrous iron transporter B [Spirochaetales bacterium]|nr:ferrous iron transporter B [Spirochaetales bacterium]